MRSTSLNTVLQALVDSTELGRFDLVSVALYDVPWEESMPTELVFVASHTHGEKELGLLAGIALPVTTLPFYALLHKQNSTIRFQHNHQISDINDKLIIKK